jgi:hypothetical protein
MIVASKEFLDMLDDDDGEPPTPEQLELRRQVLIESHAPT